MKQLFTFLYSLLMWMGMMAQAPDHHWAQSVGGTLNDEGLGIATDHDGNVFLTGAYKSSSITFGATKVNNKGGNVGSADMFLVKYDSSGLVQWFKTAGQGNYENEFGWRTKTDKYGNVYVLGTFTSAPMDFSGIYLYCNGYTNIFLVKYSPLGQVLWAKKMGGEYHDLGYDLDVSEDGSVYVTGHFRSTYFTIGDSTLSKNGGAGEIFVAKYDSMGNVLWVTAQGGSQDDKGLGIAADKFGHVYLTGYFWSDSAYFGNTILYQEVDTGSDMFIEKFDTAGNILWVKSAGGPGYNDGGSIAADADGNLYVLGNYQKSIAFEDSTYTNTGTGGTFLTKYNPAGDEIWIKTIDGTGYWNGPTLAIDKSGYVYVTMHADSSSSVYSGTGLVNYGGLDIVMAKYDSLGNRIWVKSMGSPKEDIAQAIAVDDFGNVFATGEFTGSYFSAGSIVLNNAGNVGSRDIFIISSNSEGVVGIEEIDKGQNLSFHPNPVQNILTVNFTTPMQGILITNLLGVVLYQEEASGGRTEIDVSHLPSGMYFVNNRKFVKE